MKNSCVRPLYQWRVAREVSIRRDRETKNREDAAARHETKSLATKSTATVIIGRPTTATIIGTARAAAARGQPKEGRGAENNNSVHINL